MCLRSFRGITKRALLFLPRRRSFDAPLPSRLLSSFRRSSLNRYRLAKNFLTSRHLISSRLCFFARFSLPSDERSVASLDYRARTGRFGRKYTYYETITRSLSCEESCSKSHVFTFFRRRTADDPVECPSFSSPSFAFGASGMIFGALLKIRDI